MPTGFQSGTYIYSLLWIIIMLGAWRAAFLAERRSPPPTAKTQNLVWDALVWVLIGGIIGARIWHILTPPPIYGGARAIQRISI